MRQLTPFVKTVLATVALMTALTGCVRLPETGPVVEANGKGQANPVAGPYNDPRPPQSGESPQDIVQGFLDAMTATPVQINAAQQFLSKDAQRAWNPQREMIVYSEISNPRGNSAVSVRLTGADRIGIRGDWQGALPVSDRLMGFPMVLEGDEWRIAKAPNALVIPKLFFERAYQRAFLYFFDPTGRILVPEPTYVPTGSQFAGTLVRSLLRGPNPNLSDVERSFLPPGLTSAPVAVSKSGLADIVLKGAPGSLSAHTDQLLLAQLAWTLRQVPSVSTFSLTVGGHQITDSSGNSVFPVDLGTQYDPRKPLASATLYALRNGRLVSGPATRLTPIVGPFGSADLGIGAFAVSLQAADPRVAAAAPGELLIGRVQGSGKVTQILGSPGSRFLRPSWDFARRLWAVEDTPAGARVEWVRHGRAHRLVVPEVSGQRVRQFLVSRDGSRLVAVIRGPRADRIEVSRIAYDAAGRPLSATRAKKVSWLGPGSPRVRDIGWDSPTSFVVVHLLARGVSEVRTIAVDGSTSEDNVVTTTIRKQVIGLATSPVGSTQRSYALTRHQLVDLAQDPTASVSYSHLQHITYAG
jgi:hypothetical protein